MTEAITADDVYAVAPFARTLGMTFPELTARRVRAVLTATPALSTVGAGCTAVR